MNFKILNTITTFSEIKYVILLLCKCAHVPCEIHILNYIHLISYCHIIQEIIQSRKFNTSLL